MNKERPFSEFTKIIPELLENDKTLCIFPKGSSMTPTIREGDMVTLKKPGDIKKYDIVLFTKNDGKAVLHRVVKKTKNGEYVMQGDSQRVKEFGITEENIVATVIEIKKADKTVKTTGFRFYLYSFLILHLKYIKRMFR